MDALVAEVASLRAQLQQLRTTREVLWVQPPTSFNYPKKRK